MIIPGENVRENYRNQGRKQVAAKVEAILSLIESAPNDQLTAIDTLELIRTGMTNLGLRNE